MENSNILFVDAEESVLESIRRMLLEENKSALFTTSFDEALRIIDEKDIDTLIVDITSGNMIELLEKVQETKPNIVKVVISDFSHLSKIINSIRKFNLHSFLLKPWKKQELLDSLTSAEEYAGFLKVQEREKENLTQRNVIYQKIINFKDDVGEYNKLDINALKSSLFIQAKAFNDLFKLSAEDKDFGIKVIDTATEMFSLAFPTFIEKFSISELISNLAIDKTTVICKNDLEATYLKNYSLVNQLIIRTSKFFINNNLTDDIQINIYPEEKLCIRYDLAIKDNNQRFANLFLNYLSKLLATVDCSISIEKVEDTCSFTFLF